MDKKISSHTYCQRVVLSIMTVHPKHQYRGAGSMMMKWGMDLADKINGLVSGQA